MPHLSSRCLKAGPAALAFLCLNALAAEGPAPAGCERVARASIATLAAPRYHQRVSGVGEPMELLRVDERVWQKTGGGGWKLFQPGPAVFERGARTAVALLARCERAGSDRLDGVATELWRVTTRGEGGAAPSVSQMWIGADDGLIYRNSGAAVETRIRYQGVTPP